MHAALDKRRTGSANKCFGPVLRRANKLKQRLGIGVGIDEPFPVKSKGMWARTYSFQLNEILQAEIAANEARTNRFKRLLAQVDNDLQADQPEGKR